MRAVSTENQMSVTIDKSRRDPPPRAIDPFGGIGIRWEVGTVACKDNAAITRRDHAVLDHAEIGLISAKRGKPGIVPDTIKALCHGISLKRRKLDAGINMSIHIIVLVLCPPVWKHVHSAFRISAAPLWVGP